MIKWSSNNPYVCKEEISTGCYLFVNGCQELTEMQGEGKWKKKRLEELEVVLEVDW